MSATMRFIACSLLLTFIATFTVVYHSWAEPMVIVRVGPRVDNTGEFPFHQEPARSITLIRVGPRVGISGKSPFGKDQKEEFQQYDMAAVLGLPWGWQARNSGMKLDMRLLTSAGEISAAGDTGLMATLVPLLALS